MGKSTLPPRIIADSRGDAPNWFSSRPERLCSAEIYPLSGAVDRIGQRRSKTRGGITGPQHQWQGNSKRLLTSRRSLLKVLLGSIAAGAFARMQSGAAASEPASFAVSTLVIRTRTGSHPFQVELAETAQQRRQGLQGRRRLDPQAGMLFVFESEVIASMWMKDTVLPLDMLFVAADGTIVAIARDTRPMSLQPLQSPGPVKAVLELNAGTVEQLGIGIDDRVLHPSLTTPDN